MKEIIQNIIFPSNDNLREHYKLYYRKECGVLIEEDGESVLVLGEYRHIAFNTYFNGFSAKKWKTYTDIQQIFLRLEIVGNFVLELYGYDLHALQPEKKSLGKYSYQCLQRQKIEVPIPTEDSLMVGFEISTLSKVTLYGGSYLGDFKESRRVNLSIATTTCRKEEYIKKNVRLLHEALLVKEGDIAKHLCIHIVDNGRTLKEEDFPKNKRIFLHLNKNVGGSGGFARGMLESMQQEENTHVLLMDDDVMIQPESIFRTYTLLKHVTKEYQNKFISGAMLQMENLSMQWEDIGTVGFDGRFRALKQVFHHKYLCDNLKNEKEYPLTEHSYAAWWYCCIPIAMIKKHGLPLPLFVRGDDVEYGLRCKPGFITMNGICVWHMGFAEKFNVAMSHYQENRNLLIIHAVSGVLDGVNVIRKLKMDYRQHMLRFDYDSAEITLRALEDYLKGPEFLKEDNGEKIFLENNQMLHPMEPLQSLGNLDVGLGDPYDDPKRSFIQKWLFRITYNGHRFYPKRRLKDGIMSVPYNDAYTPARIAFRKKLIAVNPINRTGYILTRNQSRYKELQKKYRALMWKYKRRNKFLQQEYAACKDYFTSEEFWRKYLEI